MRTWRKELGTYRDRAVVLRKLDYGEADRIFTLLTRDHGKVGAIAKGVRRQESKLGPSDRWRLRAGGAGAGRTGA